MTLESAIQHYEEVAEEQEDFDKFQCDYCKPGCEDGVWKETCRLPSNIPVGCSWGECSEQNCPLFPGCFECAKEHRQLAEWLRELKALNENDDVKDVFKDCDTCKYQSLEPDDFPCDRCCHRYINQYVYDDKWGGKR